MKAIYMGLLIGSVFCVGLLGSRNAHLHIENQVLQVQLEEQRISWSRLEVNCTAAEPAWTNPQGNGTLKL